MVLSEGKVKANFWQILQLDENQRNISEGKSIVLPSPPFTVAVHKITFLQGCESTKRPQQNDCLVFEKEMYIFPLSTYIYIVLLINELNGRCRKCRQKNKELMYARARENSCSPLRQEIEFLTFEIEMPISKVEISGSKVVVAISFVCCDSKHKCCFISFSRATFRATR